MIGKLTTSLAVALLCDLFQGFIIQLLWMATAGFITKDRSPNLNFWVSKSLKYLMT